MGFTIALYIQFILNWTSSGCGLRLNLTFLSESFVIYAVLGVFAQMMSSAPQHVLLISDDRQQGQKMANLLGSAFALEHVCIEDGIPLRDVRHLPAVVMCSLNSAETVIGLRRLFRAGKLSLSQRVFITPAKDRRSAIQAEALGATVCMSEPYDSVDLLRLLLPPREEIAHSHGAGSVDAVVDGGSEALRELFSGLLLGDEVEMETVATHAVDISETLGDTGIGTWMERVRTYHHGTYQHCLSVTGLAVAFGQHLKMSKADVHRLSVAGLVHDVGKARIPLNILDKPARLSDPEFEVMKTHTILGYEYLAGMSEVDEEMRRAVRWHHQYLDGTGYPDVLSADEIPDLVRVLTIADVFGALTERRAYKAHMPAEQAFNMLLELGPKLDQPLVKAFKEVALASG